MSLIDLSSPFRLEQIELGQVFSTSERFDQSSMDAFARLSGDYSAIHVDREVAQKHGFPDRLQYGFLLASLLSRIVGSNFYHAVCAAVSLDFVKPVTAQALVDVSAKVNQVQHALRSVALTVTMSCDGSIVIRGKLTAVFLPEPKE